MNKQKKPYHHGGLRQAILDEALRHVGKEGIETLSLRACSKAVQVSPGAAFRHFKDKRSLATAMAAHGFALMAETIKERQAQAAPSAMAKFRAVGEGYVLFALREPNLFRLMFSKGQIDPEDPRLREQAEGIPMFTASGKGKLSTGDMLSWGLVHGLSELAIADHFDGTLPEGIEGKLDALTKVMAAMGPSFRALAEEGAPRAEDQRLQ